MRAAGLAWCAKLASRGARTGATWRAELGDGADLEAWRVDLGGEAYAREGRT